MLVVGGGIAGLAIAHALARTGQAVEVWEQAQAFTEVGAGLQVTPNAFAALQALGLKDATEAVCHLPPSLQMGDAASGRVIFERSVAPIEAAFGQPYAVAHRAALHGVLLTACNANPLIALHTRRAIAVADVKALTQERQVIGADGLYSAVRRALHGERAPTHSGYVAYRALLPLQATDSPDVQMWAGPGRHLVSYPVKSPAGEAQLNVVAFFRREQQPTGWDAAADPAPLHAAWVQSCAKVKALLARATEQQAWRSWAVADREPDAQPSGWTSGPGWGPVVLVGDAAHPMLPFAAQGANMALEDAAVLGRLWADITPASAPVSAADATTLFSRFAALRHARTARVQALARRNRVLYHAAGPLAWARDLALRLAPPARRSMDWVYEWKPPLA